MSTTTEPKKTLASESAGDPAADLTEMPNQPGTRFGLWLGLGVVIILSVYFLRLNQAVGHYFVDDAYYVVLAKALATGQGYRLINSPSGALMPLYPPGFPALLSIAYRLSPSFPDNLWLLKLVSIAAMLGAGVITFYLFRHYRRCSLKLALGIALATVLTPGLVMLATATVMSECVYLFIYLATLFVIETALRKEQHQLVYLALGGALTAVGFLTRSAGIALFAAVLVYLFKERLWRLMLIYALIVVTLVTPWQIFARRNLPTASQRKEQEGYIVTSYAEQFWQVRAGDANSGEASLSMIPGRIWNNISGIAAQDIDRILFAPLTEAARQQASADSPTMILMKVFSTLLFLLILLGFGAALRQRLSLLELFTAFSLGMIILWPWDTFRYTITLTPLLLYYLLLGVGAVERWRRKDKADLVANSRGPERLQMVFVALILVTSLVGHARYLMAQYAASPLEQPAVVRGFRENLELLNWVKNTLPPTEVLAAQNPPLVYLYTGHKTISAQNLGDNQDTMRRFNVRQLVINSPFPVPNPDLQGGKYKITHRVRGELNLFVMDFGPPETH